MKLRTLFAGMGLALLAACAAPVQRPPMEIDAFVLEDTFTLAKDASKALYDSFGQTLYALNTQDQTITVLAATGQKNVIGGLGTGEANFLRLSDIALAPGGGILALDQSAKVVKKFDPDGQYMSTMDIKGVTQPALIALSGDQLLQVFDQASSEIVVYSLLDGSAQNRFGKFELGALTMLSCNRDYVVGYDSATDTSHVFSSLGQFVKSEPGQTLYDDYNNGINLRAQALSSQMSPALLPVSVSNCLMTLAGNMLVLAEGMEINLYKIEYLQVN